MKERSRRGRKGGTVDTPIGRDESGPFAEARNLLKGHLVHTREIPNGKDFLFLGSRETLHGALTQIVDFEHKSKRFVHVDFAEVDGYYLLRVVGLEEDQQRISTYFD